MKLKLDENGHAVLQDGMPVYVHDDGKEEVFDGAKALSKISSLNAEAKTHREAKEQALNQLKDYEGLDAAKAREALQKLGDIDSKKLIDAGEVDKVRQQISEQLKGQYGQQINQLTEQLNSTQGALNNELIGGGFNRSKFISENISSPIEMLKSQFGGNFKVEEGKLVAYGVDGQKILSRKNFGEVADFDEAMETLVNGCGFKDQILKGNQSQGGGFQGNGGQGGAPKTWSDCKTQDDQVAFLKTQQ
jgi:hypothetical protein